MILYNEFAHKIVNLDNVVSVYIFNYTDGTDIKAEACDGTCFQVVSLAKGEEKTAQDLLKAIYKALANHKHTFAICDSNSDLNLADGTENYIGLTD